jgi:hypothetical protein
MRANARLKSVRTKAANRSFIVVIAGLTYGLSLRA